MSLFSFNITLLTHTHTLLNFFHLCGRRGRGERGERRGLRLVSGSQLTWLAAGSIWSCKEGLPTLTSEETNICLKGQETERERERASEKKILISLQTHREIKVGKTYPSKGCRVSCKMEIFPKLTDPVGRWQGRGGRTRARRGKHWGAQHNSPNVDPTLTSVHTLTYSEWN